MISRKVVLNPGENEIAMEQTELGYAGGVLWLYVRGLTMAQAFALLSDPANTGVIEFWYGEMMDRYEGYTRLTTLMERDGQVSASLMKEASADV